MSKKIYSAFSTKEMCSLYQTMNPIDKKVQIDSFNPHFSHLDDNELASVAKNNEEAKEELHQRFQPLMTTFMKIYAKKYKVLTRVEISSKVEDVFAKAIEIFEQRLGSFIHLLRKMITLNITGMAIKKYRQQLNQNKNYGIRVSLIDNDMPLYNNSINALNDVYQKRAISIDLREFIQTLPSPKKEIFSMYCMNYSVTEIAKIVNMPYSTCMTNIISIKKSFYETIHLKKTSHTSVK